jgi:hypothetical protein
MKHLQRFSLARQRRLTLATLPMLAMLSMQGAPGWAAPADITATATSPVRLRASVPEKDAVQANPTGKVMADDKPSRKKVRTPAKRTEQNKRKQRGLANQEAAAQEAEQRLTEERNRLHAARIQELLVQATRDFDAGRLLEPPRNNAAQAYQQVLALDPNQLEALAGAQRIIDLLAAEAERTAAAGDRSRTQQYIGTIRALQPNDATLLELEARLAAMNESPVVLSVRQQERYGRSAESIERAYAALQSQPLDQHAINQAMAEYERAESLVEQAPGLPMLKQRILVAFPAATQNELARDNSRRALKVVAAAREHGWLTPELEMLERAATDNLAAR